MNRLRRILAALFVGASLAITAVPAQAASCLDSNGALSSYCKLDSQSNLNIPEGSLAHRITQILDILGLIAGVLSVLFIVIGGIKYATSEGDSSRLSSAKQTLTYAIIGLIVSIIAPLIVGFVIAKGPQ